MFIDMKFASSKKTKKCVIFFHGYGADGKNLIDLSYYFADTLPHVFFYAPNAPFVCESNSSGYQWFSLPDADMREEGLRHGLQSVRELVTSYIKIKLEEHNLSPSDCVVVGFSQGGMVALDLLFSFEDLGGVISYSGAFVEPIDAPLLGKNTPVLLVHGSRDDIIPYSAMASAQYALARFGVRVSSVTCTNTGHSIDETGLKEGLSFLKTVFKM